MNANYLYQIVYCSQRPGRAFRREIAISQNSAMVTNIEILPPGYDVLMDRMRNPDDRVLRFAADLKTVRDDMGCPFCGNRTTFTCDRDYGGCGAISCMGDHNGHHCCPACKVVHRAVPTDKFLVSKSGFVDRHADASHRLGGSGSNKLLGDQDEVPYWRKVWEDSQRQQVIDAEVVEPPKRLQRLLPALQRPADKLQDALRRGLPPAPSPEPRDPSGLPWTKFLCDGSQHSDEDGMPPDPPPRKLLGDGSDTRPSDGEENRIARLSDRLNRSKR